MGGWYNFNMYKGCGNMALESTVLHHITVYITTIQLYYYTQYTVQHATLKLRALHYSPEMPKVLAARVPKS